jgi:phage terminase large subunit-like protein
MRKTARAALTLPDDPVAFIDLHLPNNEKGEAWTLNRHQRRVLARAYRRHPETGRLLFQIILWSEVKKSGKTALAGALVIWWAFTHARTEVICASNDYEQAVGRVFATCVALLEANPALRSAARILADKILLANGTTIKAIPSDYKGAAGSRHSLVVFDELWAYAYEAAQRLFEELTPPPTEVDAHVLIVTYAGISGESLLLQRLYDRAMAAPRVDDELEMYEDAGLFCFWSHTPRMPWQTQAYYDEQRRHLRPATFDRLHRNVFVTAEGAAFTPVLWDGATDPQHIPCWPDKRLVVYGGVDAATKDDCAAVVFITLADRLYLVRHHIWRPRPGEPLDLAATVEAALLQADRDFTLGAVFCDPYQMARSMMTLQQLHIPIAEFAQTQAGTTRMGSALYDLLRGRGLVLYPDAELRQQALNVVAVETTRGGFRLAKAAEGRKIDGIAALALACVAAMDHNATPRVEDATPEVLAREGATAFLGAGGPRPIEPDYVDEEPVGGW